MKKFVFSFLSVLALGMSADLFAQVDIKIPESVATRGNQRSAAPVVLYQSDRSRSKEVTPDVPISEDALSGNDTRSARVSLYDGNDLVPIKRSRVSTQVVNGKLHVIVDTDGLPKPKNGKRFKVRLTDPSNKSKEFDLK